MSSRRLLKAAEAIREVVSMAILTELKDPRVKNVTVTYVEVAADMRSAKVHVSIMGSETQQNLALRGLQNAAGFLQHLLSEKIDTRYTPRLVFSLDQGVKHSIAVAEILRGVLPAAPSAASEVQVDTEAGEVNEDELDDSESTEHEEVEHEEVEHEEVEHEDDEHEDDEVQEKDRSAK
jgi:ribosome-binding factor A